MQYIILVFCSVWFLILQPGGFYHFLHLVPVHGKLKAFNFQVAYVFPQHLILLQLSKFCYQYLLASSSFQYYNMVYRSTALFKFEEVGSEMTYGSCEVTLQG